MRESAQNARIVDSVSRVACATQKQNKDNSHSKDALEKSGTDKKDALTKDPLKKESR
jgi:hypothetical protein